MGESSAPPRRSTLVSRLPIFRRSCSSKKQDSLPSSPSSGGVSNGVHTSSPSSTNSSSGSTGKRRSLFSRAPSLSFASKRHSEPRVQPPNLNLTPPLTSSTATATDANGNNQQQTTVALSSSSVSVDGSGSGRTKSRHTFGFGSHKQKKITRSQTEDFDKGSSSSAANHRNVFINCISSSGTNEGDDSGFLDDYSNGSNNNQRTSSSSSSTRQKKKKQLLPKSFSAHHRFSRTSDHHRPPEVTLEPPTSTSVVAAAPAATVPATGGLTPGSWPGDMLGVGPDGLLQSPMISEDGTTAVTPSEFIPITEDSASEVDALPAPSPTPGGAPGPPSLPGEATDPGPPDLPPTTPPVVEGLSQVEPADQVFCTAAQSGVEQPPPPALPSPLPDDSTANHTDYDTAVSQSEPETAVPCLPAPPTPTPPTPTTPPAAPPPAPPATEQQQQQQQQQKQQQQSPVEGRNGKAEQTVEGSPRDKRTSSPSHEGDRKWPAGDWKWPSEDRKWGYQTETTSESEGGGGPRSEGWHSNPERSERRGRNAVSVQEVGRGGGGGGGGGGCCGFQEHRPSHLRRPHAVSMCSSMSPYHGVMRLERRLRSSSEGAGGPRIQGNHGGDAHGNDGCGALLKHRNNSSSSKLDSLDMLNNLGSSELDEDDLMLDLDLSDDQRHRHVSREDSSQSLASCLNLLPSPIEAPGDRLPGGREVFHRQPSRPTSLLPTDWSSALGLGKDEDPLPVGLEALPLRLMQQDCTSVKTLLLRLRRTLQESTETSPASSLQSLPISPCSEKSLPLKDLCREEALLQQLREKDEIILRLQNELESAKAALRTKACQTTDRTTQTEHTGPEASHPGWWAGLGSSSNSLALRERRGVRGAGGLALGGDPSSQHLPHHHHHINHHHPRGPPPGPERHTAREERYCQGVLAPSSARPGASSPGASLTPGPGPGAPPGPRLPASSQALGHQAPCGTSTPLATPSPVAMPTEGLFFSSAESLAAGGGGFPGVGRRAAAAAGGGGGEGHLPPSQIPRVGGGAISSPAPHAAISSSSLAGGGSPCPSTASSSSSPSSPPPQPQPARPSTSSTSSSSSSSSSIASSSSMFAGRLGQPPRGPLSLHSYSRKNVFLQHSLHTAELQALAHRDG